MDAQLLSIFRFCHVVNAFPHDLQNPYKLKLTSCAAKPHMHNLVWKLVLMFSDYKAAAFLEPSEKIKSNLYYTQDNTSKRITSGGAHLRSLAPGQHSIKKRRSGGDPLATLSEYSLTGLEVEPLPSTPKALSLSLYQPAGYCVQTIQQHQIH